MTPTIITISLAFIVLISYAAVGFWHYKKDRSFLSYYLSERGLGKAHIRNTLAGAAISISTVLIFFFTIGFQFGWQILISPLTLAIGVLFFRYLIYPKLFKKELIQHDKNKTSALQIDSLSDLILQLYGSRILTITITLVSALGILAILVAELMVGVSILQIGNINPSYVLLFVSIVLFIYAGLGGLQSVVVTDRWQIRIVLLSLFFVLLYTTKGAFDISPETAKDLLMFNWAQNIKMPLSLIMNITIVNICLLPSSLRVWQIVSASKPGPDFGKALWESTLIIVFASICALLIGKSVQIIINTPNMTIELLFEYLMNSSFFSGYILYPLFSIALISALVSTADSAILPLAQSIHSTISKKFNQALNLIIVAVLILICNAAYYVVTNILNMGVINWILTVFSITTVIAPAILYPLFIPPRKLTRSGEIFMSIGLIFACFIALFWSISYSKNLSIQPWNCVFGVSISAIFTILAEHLFAEK